MLAGRGALVTGGSQGFGLEVARALVHEGADVFICAREGGDLERARAELVALSSPGQRIGAHVADVAREQDVLELVAAVAELLPRFCVLVNNAGIYGPMGQLADVDWGEWLQAISVNLAGSALTARAAFPHFLHAGYGKVIQLSGGGATAPLPGLSAYAASKAAVVRLAETLALEWRAHKIDVNAVAPGALNTRLLDEVLAAGPERVGRDFYERSLKQRDTGGVPLQKGAELAVFLASAQSDGITGRLLSAVWDDWANLPARREALARTDVFTLRRIVPEDRRDKWLCA